METVGSALQSHGGTAAEITHRAHGILYGQLVQQANLLAYVDAFRVLVVLCVLCLPGVFLFRRAKRKGPVMAH
jgi:DHA2 family multidrug resistance protein